VSCKLKNHKKAREKNSFGERKKNWVECVVDWRQICIIHKNREGKLNENTVNKAFRMGADSGTKPKDRESGQRKRKWK